MPPCVACDRAVPVSDACAHCAAPVCATHRDPAAHDCPGVDADRTGGWFTDPDAGRRAASGDDERPRELSNPRRLAVGLAVAALLALALAAVAPSPAGGGLNETAVERAIADRANEVRAERGLDRLRWDPALARVAENHSRDMLRRGYFGHTAPDGTDLWTRYERAGIDCAGGENIYATPNGDLSVTEEALARKVVRELLRSPEHRRALLAPGYSRQGIGVAAGADGGLYVTQDLC